MTRLTEDLLTLARVESGEQRFDMQRVSPEELLQDALESFREVARSYGVELGVELEIENSVPAGRVNADREAIHQIFSNLIENALKYAASGKKVILGARAAESGVEFYVRDFGPVSYTHLDVYKRQGSSIMPLMVKSRRSTSSRGSLLKRTSSG